MVLPLWLNIMPLTILRLCTVIIALAIAVYLFWLRGKSSSTRVLAWVFVGAVLYTSSLIVGLSGPYDWQHYLWTKRIGSAIGLLGSCLMAVCLPQFALRFPRLLERHRRESRITLALGLTLTVPLSLAIVTANLLMIAGEPPRWLGLLGLVSTVVLGVQFTWAIAILLRKTLSARGSDTRPWWRRIVRPIESDALATRSIALLFVIPVLEALQYLVPSTSWFFAYSWYLSEIALLLFSAFFLVVYFNHSEEPATFRVKLIGGTLVTVLVVLGSVGFFMGNTLVEMYRNSEPVSIPQTITFSPNTRGGYEISRIPFRWEDDTGVDLELGGRQTATVRLASPFPFFGRAFPDVYVRDDGCIFFEKPEVFAYSGWGGSRQDPAIAPLIMDLNPEAGGGSSSATTRNRR